MATLHHLACPRCGHRYSNRYKFCKECGAELPSPPQVHRASRTEIRLALVALGASILSFLAWLLVVIRPDLFPERLGELATSVMGVVWAALNLGILAYAAAQLEPKDNSTTNMDEKGKTMSSDPSRRQVNVTDESKSQSATNTKGVVQQTGKGSNFHLSGSTLVALAAIAALVVVVWMMLTATGWLSSRGPATAPSAASATTTMSPAPSLYTPAVTPTPIPPTNTWTPSPTASPTATSTASPVLPSSTPTATHTPIPPTSTGAPTPTPLPPTGTWTPVPTAPRPAPTRTPIPQPPTATRRPPTATPKPPTAAPRIYPAPQLVAPANDASFDAGATVTLQWASVGPLAAGDHYLLAVQHSAGTSWVVMDSTSWVTHDWLQQKQPITWWVAVCRGAALGESGTPPGSLAGPQSATRRFTWTVKVIVTPPE